MLKKKSYMNRNSLLSEGFFEKFVKFFKSVPKLNTDEKQKISKVSGKLKRSVDSMNKSIDSYEKIIKKQLGDDYPDLPRFEPKDFVG